jgi:hypothetical protein
LEKSGEVQGVYVNGAILPPFGRVGRENLNDARRPRRYLAISKMIDARKKVLWCEPEKSGPGR